MDPAVHHSSALLHAAHRGHWLCVQMLIPVSDPNARNGEALWRAAKNRHGRVVRLLAPVSDTSGWREWVWDDLPPKRWKRFLRRPLVTSDRDERPDGS
ncbi:hypothetical protein [Luteibacter anthropi]|uniref:hypothetical protein n=1 Tax=Luteibacter anthropi TaxID=564369 RepID=UPI003CE4963F